MLVTSYSMQFIYTVYPNCVPHQSDSLVLVALFSGALIWLTEWWDYLDQEGDADAVQSSNLYQHKELREQHVIAANNANNAACLGNCLPVEHNNGLKTHRVLQNIDEMYM